MALSLTYRGKDLLAPTLRLQDWVDDHFDLDSFFPASSQLSCVPNYMPFTRGAQTRTGSVSPSVVGGVQVPPFSPRPRLKLNQLYWPTGASRFACGVFLVDDVSVQQMSGANVLKVTRDAATVFAATMEPLNPRRLTSTDGSNPLWLLPLVCRRWLLNRTASSAYSLTAADTATTWKGLIEGFLEGEGLTAPAAHADYMTPEMVLWAGAGMLGRFELADAAAANCGLRLVYRPDGGGTGGMAWECQDPATAEAEYDANLADDWAMTRGGTSDDQTLRAPYPGEIWVEFGADHYTDAGVDLGKNIYEGIAENRAGGAGGVAADGVVRLGSSAWHRSGIGSPNTSELDSLRSRLATDIFDWTKILYDYTFCDTQPWTINGYDDFVLFDFGSLSRSKRVITDDDGETSRMCFPYWQTRVVSRAEGDFPTNYAHRSSHEATCNWARWIEFELQANELGTVVIPGDSGVANLRAYWDGMPPVAIGGAITVWNFGTRSVFYGGPATLMGYAVLDQERRIYRIVVMEC
jgi:hypothetical protein